MSQGDTLLRPANVFALAKSDTLAVDSGAGSRPPRQNPGDIGWLRDAFGTRYFTYRINRNGSTIVQNALASRPVNLAFTTITSPTTTSITKSAAFTANQMIGGFLIDSADSGASPETNYTIIKSNTASLLTFDDAMPFAVAPGTGATYNLIGSSAIASAASDLAWVVLGVQMATTAPADGDFSWYQFHGLHPSVRHKSATGTTASNGVKADVATVTDQASATVTQTTVGWQIGGHPSTAGVQTSSVLLSLLQWWML